MEESNADDVPMEIYRETDHCTSTTNTMNDTCAVDIPPEIINDHNCSIPANTTMEDRPEEHEVPFQLIHEDNSISAYTTMEDRPEEHEVPFQLIHEDNYSISADTTMEDRPEEYDVPFQLNHYHNCSIPENTTMDDRPEDDNVPFEITHDHNCPIPANTIMEDRLADYIPIQLTHDHYRFAYDLVEKVLEIRGELNHNIPHNLPEPQNYLFTDEHVKIIKSLLQTEYGNTAYLLKDIYKITNGVYDYQSYLKCRCFFVGHWKTTSYTEKSFISGCTSIAYVAAHFIQMNFNCHALDDVVAHIAYWLGDILRRGTISQSSWR